MREGKQWQRLAHTVIAPSRTKTTATVLVKAKYHHLSQSLPQPKTSTHLQLSRHYHSTRRICICSTTAATAAAAAIAIALPRAPTAAPLRLVLLLLLPFLFREVHSQGLGAVRAVSGPAEGGLEVLRHAKSMIKQKNIKRGGGEGRKDNVRIEFDWWGPDTFSVDYKTSLLYLSLPTIGLSTHLSPSLPPASPSSYLQKPHPHSARTRFSIPSWQSPHSSSSSSLSAAPPCTGAGPAVPTSEPV